MIIQACQAHNALNRYSDGNGGMIACVLRSGTYMVKYGVSGTAVLVTRIHTQPWLHAHSKARTKAQTADGPGICVPELFHVFDDGGRTYLVMQFVELEPETPGTDMDVDMDARIEDALGWLASLTNGGKEGERLGPLGGGCIVHDFFAGNEREAPVAFTSPAALERYIAKARTRIPNYKHLTHPVSLRHEPLVFTQGIVHPAHRHFGLTKTKTKTANRDTATVIMGIGNMAFVPHSLARYTLACSDTDYAGVEAIPDKLGWMGGGNVDTLVMVAANLGMTANLSLNLDENGMPTKPTKKKKKVAATATPTAGRANDAEAEDDK